MKPITKLHLKTFLYTGIPFGLIILAVGLANGDEDIVWKFLFATFFFGAIMSLVLVSLHKYTLKKNGTREITDKNIGVNQTRSIKSSLNKFELIEKLEEDPIIGKMKIFDVENEILIETKMSWKSWGEEIKIIVGSHKESDFEYKISSSSKVKTTIVDYGKNLENVNLIENIVKNIA